MKKLMCLIVALATCSATFAQVNITKVGKVQPNDEIFMDMAVTAAQKAVADGQKPNGAVIVQNGAWKGTGLPGNDATPEENAILKSGRTKLPGAAIYTINQPTIAAVNAAMAADIEVIYYVNPSEEVVTAGIYEPTDYDEAALQTNPPTVAIFQMTYAPASDLIKQH